MSTNTVVTATRPIDVGAERTISHVLRGLAVLGSFLLGLHLDIVNGVGVGLLLPLVLVPLWARTLRSFVGARVLLLVTVVTVAGGWILYSIAPFGHSYSPANAVAAIGYVVTIGVGAMFLLWARTVVRDGTILIALGVGLLASIDTHFVLFSSNPWKFGFSVPMTVIVLGILQLGASRVVQLVAICVFSGLLIVSDARSGLGILVITGLVLLYQGRPRTRTRRSSAIGFVVLAVGLAFIVYRAVEWLILNGVFGAATQARTAAQLATAGSLLLGGRPELGASAALFRLHPFGFGPGAKPGLTDLHTAQSGMAALGYDPDNGYVYNYMFGGHIELHSTIADLWASFGLPGLLMALVTAVLLIRGIALGAARSTMQAGVLYLAVDSLWNLPFSPIGGSYVILAAALGMSLTRVDRSAIAPALRRRATARRDRRALPTPRPATPQPAGAPR